MVFNQAMGKVAIKGKNFLGFEIEIHQTDKKKAFNELESLLAVSSQYMKNAIITLKLNSSNKSLAGDFIDFLKEKGILLSAIVVEDKENLNVDLPVIELKHIHLVNEANEREVSTFRGNLRSGQSIKANGDLVVVGNVNSNSYIYATGNIFVLGKLYGVPHAGYGGNDDAVIFAFDLNPPQIRIGNYITRSPEENVLLKKRDNIVSEVAYVDEDGIVIMSYSEWLNTK
ncbi:septum site-determining protein minC [Hippea maritima DSM 10411]|uniref:Probable septum site-determining protein MinC n=2 Tax=Hippea TaxID=84404 RepID=F2LXJ2_HIPMA|nr:septum site-determining protein minC [Hippea maritima DSM 10411]